MRSTSMRGCSVCRRCRNLRPWPSAAAAGSSAAISRSTSVSTRPIAGAGFAVVDEQGLTGHDRVYVDDPFGNRIELMQPVA